MVCVHIFIIKQSSSSKQCDAFDQTLPSPQINKNQRQEKQTDRSRCKRSLWKILLFLYIWEYIEKIGCSHSHTSPRTLVWFSVCESYGDKVRCRSPHDLSCHPFSRRSCGPPQLLCHMVGRVGFEPTQHNDNGFTDRRDSPTSPPPDIIVFFKCRECPAARNILHS